MSRVRISGSHNDSLEVVVDGQDISEWITTASLYLSAGQPAQLIVEPVAFAGASVDLDAVVEVDQETSKLLHRLGWSPPARLS